MSDLAPRVVDDSRPPGETVEQRAERIAQGFLYDEDYPPCSACGRGKYFAEYELGILCHPCWIIHFFETGKISDVDKYDAAITARDNLPG